MSSKRKAEIHSRGPNRPRTMKSGGSQVDSERDSGFSGGARLASPAQRIYVMVLRYRQVYLYSTSQHEVIQSALINIESSKTVIKYNIIK